MVNCPPVDIAIVGAALVGSTLASALTNSGYSVALLEQRDLTLDGKPSIAADQQQESNALLSVRTTALSLSSIRILQALGLWQDLEADAVEINQVHVSQQGNFGTLRIQADEQRLDCLGAVVNNQVYQRLLLNRLHENANLSLYSPATVTHLDNTQPELVNIRFSAGSTEHQLAAKLLIGVDGARSAVRSMLDVPCKVTDYEQSVVLLGVETESENYGIAYERFTAAGPVAFLPIGEKASSVICTIDSDELDSVSAFDDHQMLNYLQQRFGYRLGRLLECSPRHIMPVYLTESETQVSGRALLMGNAARSLHPVAGQGFNLALRDAAELIEMLQAVATADVSHSDPGNAQRLAEFVRSRKADQNSTLQLTDGLARLFRGHHAGLSHLRALGLLGLEHVTPLRQGFARQAMGSDKLFSQLAKQRSTLNHH